MKDGRLNERSNHEQEDNSFDLCGGYAACFRLFRAERLGGFNCADGKLSLNNGIIIDEVSGNVYKDERNANPISPNIFCADPTAVEYNGRLYVYGTNDTQQAELAKAQIQYDALINSMNGNFSRVRTAMTTK